MLFEAVTMCLLLAATPDSSGRSLAAPDTSAAAAPRIVRTLEAFEVRGFPLDDPLSTETVQRVARRALRTLPVDRYAQAVALKAGVVARGEDLHVRGGRAGETAVVLDGITLTEPLRGRPLELPLLALQSAELLAGGMDADAGGALAGVIALTTLDPPARLQGVAEWRGDAGVTGYDHVGARLAGPVPGAPVGFVATAEALLDETHLPSLRSNGRRSLSGGSFGWRADNRLLGDLRLATLGRDTRASLELLATRSVSQPFDPAWTVDGWTIPCDDPNCIEGPKVSPVPVDGYVRYRAADHRTLTDERQFAAVLALERRRPAGRHGLSLGWIRTRSITALGGRDDESYLDPARAPVFGIDDSPTSEPFYVYSGDEPFFRRATSESFQSHGFWEHRTRRDGRLKAGAGMRYDEVSLRSLDMSTPGFGLDSLRAYRTWAPSVFAYAHGRWSFEGLAANAGARLESFTAGPQAERQSLGAPAQVWWTLSPRLGIAYPISDRDVFSLSYVRVQQAPARDFLYDNRLDISNRQPLGNPALGPATSIAYQAGLKHLIGREWSVQASVFYRDLSGIIVARNAQPKSALPRLVYRDDGSGSASGFEGSALWSRGSDQRLEVHYTWMDARGTFSSAEGTPYGPRLAARPESIAEHPLDWDRRHSLALTWLWRRGEWSGSWSTRAGSPLPWTPAQRRTQATDLSATNSRRLGWEESSALSVRWSPAWTSERLTLGVDVLNVFDRRNETAATVDGYPHPSINTRYDDYAAYRSETGLGGGAYWNDRDGDGSPGWRPVHDPRLSSAPRQARFYVSAAW